MTNERWSELLDADRGVTMVGSRAEAIRVGGMDLRFRALAVSVNVALRDWWAYSPGVTK